MTWVREAPAATAHGHDPVQEEVLLHLLEGVREVPVQVAGGVSLMGWIWTKKVTIMCTLKR